jgi:hypothetical protein
MMNIKFFRTVLVITTLVFAGCSDDDNPTSVCPNCPTAPEARPEFDNSGKGIYRGLVVGSSGSITFNIGNNAGDSIYAVLTIDGQIIPLRTSATYNPSFGFQGVFRGRKNNPDDVVIGMWASADGSEYGIVGDPVIPGHTSVTIVLIKELSTAQTKVFEGTMAGSISGTFNVVLRGNLWRAVARPQDGTADDEGRFQGAISGNTLECDCPDNISIRGTITGDIINGNWEVDTGGGDLFSGTWTARRTN